MSINCVDWKIDYYMNKYIKPYFPLEKIHWYFSLSGGKDSYVLAKSIANWHLKNRLPIRATGVHFMQWDDSSTAIEARFHWLDELLFFDLREKTASTLCENQTAQAPCSKCSLIRKECSDHFFSQLNSDKNDMIPILCRGLHLTDMANSMIWRLVWEHSPIDSLFSRGKGKPLVKLFSNVYLAKPLCFVREYESQTYADAFHYSPYQCECPALKYPSRRDIIEESVSLYYNNSLWEFEVPGMDRFFETVLACEKNLVSMHSVPGKESKQATLPEGFFSFAVDYFRRITEKNRTTLLSKIHDKSRYLEDAVPQLLSYNRLQSVSESNLNFKLLTSPDSLTEFDRKMIATLGPYWGAISLESPLREVVFNLQKEIYGYRIDQNWSQVIDLLLLYYHL